MSDPILDAARTAAFDAAGRAGEVFGPSDAVVAAGVVAALRGMADLVDSGPTFPMPPSIISALIRERADQIEAEVEA